MYSAIKSTAAPKETNYLWSGYIYIPTTLPPPLAATWWRDRRVCSHYTPAAWDQDQRAFVTLLTAGWLTKDPRWSTQRDGQQLKYQRHKKYSILHSYSRQSDYWRGAHVAQQNEGGDGVLCWRGTHWSDSNFWFLANMQLSTNWTHTGIKGLSRAMVAIFYFNVATNFQWWPFLYLAAATHQIRSQNIIFQVIQLTNLHM